MAVWVRNLQVDVAPEAHDAAVAWWAAALGGTPRSTDEPEYTHLDGVRSPVGVHVQRLGEGPGGYHLDLETDDDIEAEVARLLDLGASDVAALPGGEPGRVLADPAGLPFCLTTTGQAQVLAPTGGGELELRVLMFDVPGDLAEQQAAFWAAAVGESHGPVPNYPDYTWVRGVEGPGGTVHVAVQRTGSDTPPRLHVDLHCADSATRDGEVARLTDLGAEKLDATHHWVVLRTPGDHLACVVPDAR